MDIDKLKRQNTVVRVYLGPIDGYEKIEYTHADGSWRIRREDDDDWEEFARMEYSSSDVKEMIKRKFDIRE